VLWTYMIVSCCRWMVKGVFRLCV